MKRNWEYKKLGEITTQITDGSHNPPKGCGYSDFPMLSSKNVFFDCLNYEDPRYLSEEEFALENKRTNIADGDVLLTIVGTVGRACCVKEPFQKFVLQRSVAVLKPNYKYIRSRYLMFCLTAMSSIFDREAKGVAQKGVYLKQLASMPIPVPPLDEQSRIVAELDLLTGIIDKQNAQLKELDSLAQSIFYDMFGDPIENEKGWYIKTLENIGKCVSGGTPSRKNAEFFEGNINWYSAGELNSLYLEESVEKITEAALKESAAKLCKANSLFIGMYDTAAFKLGITKTEAASNQACANVFPKEDNVIWLYFVLSIMRDEALKCRHGARQKNLNLGFIKSFPVPVPPLALQQSFAEKIQSIEKQKETIRASIADTQKLLDYTMEKYFG